MFPCQELLCIWNSPLWVELMNLKWILDYSLIRSTCDLRWISGGTLKFDMSIWSSPKSSDWFEAFQSFQNFFQSEWASDYHVILRSNFENTFLNFAFFLCYKSLQCCQPNHPFLGDLPLWKVTNKVSRVSKIYKKSWQNRITELTWNDVQ